MEKKEEVIDLSCKEEISPGGKNATKIYFCPEHKKIYITCAGEKEVEKEVEKDEKGVVEKGSKNGDDDKDDINVYDDDEDDGGTIVVDEFRNSLITDADLLRVANNVIEDELRSPTFGRRLSASDLKSTQAVIQKKVKWFFLFILIAFYILYFLRG